MRAVRFEDAGAFYARACAALGAREIEHSMLLGLARGVAERGGPALMLGIEADGALVAAALQTPPYQLHVCVLDAAAIAPLADAAWDAGAALPAVMGLPEPATRFAERWSARSGGAWRLEHETMFYALAAVRPPPPPADGRLRPASPADLDWLTSWFAAFAEEAGLPARERGLGHARRYVGGKLGRAELFVWTVGERPVGFAGFSPTGIGGARVGPVMTVPAERRNGYASAAVAALSQLLLDRGHAWCGLFADVANPASNRIYRRLGYEAACRLRSIALGADTGATSC